MLILNEERYPLKNRPITVDSNEVVITIGRLEGDDLLRRWNNSADCLTDLFCEQG